MDFARHVVSVCSFRAELLEIGRDIDYLKDKLGLVDLI